MQAQAPASADLAEVARATGLPLSSEPDARAEFALRRIDGRLALVRLSTRRERPLVIDFADAAARRLARAKSQPLARALGKSPGRVVDATAGLGRDAVVLAAVARSTVLVERDPVLWALLRDALLRAAEARETRELAGRITLVRADAREWLPALPEAERPDVCYLDPMYSQRRKGSAKREMQWLQELLGPEPDAVELLQAARAAALRRVVVKRPPRAPPLAPGVHHAIASKLVRFDVYEKNSCAT